MTLSKHRWTIKQLGAVIDELDDEVKIYWDYRDELDGGSIEKIIDQGLEGVDEVEQELIDINLELLSRSREQAIEEALSSMKLIAPVSKAAEKRLREMVDDSDKLRFSANLKGLAGRSEVECVVIMNSPEYFDYASHYGIRCMDQVEQLCQILDLLNVNPAHMQRWVLEDYEDPARTPTFPSRPERDGQEFVDIGELHTVMNEINHGGQLTFLVSMRLSDLLEDVESIKKGPIRVKAGTWCFPYCFGLGSGPCAEMILTRDLILEAGSYDFRLDSALHHGVQSCYGFTSIPWRAGSITPL